MNKDRDYRRYARFNFIVEKDKLTWACINLVAEMGKDITFTGPKHMFAYYDIYFYWTNTVFYQSWLKDCFLHRLLLTK